MKKSFFIFVLVLVVLITLILLRLQSVTFPKEIGENTEIIYLEEFPDDGHIFKIFSDKNRFFLKPYIYRIRLNGTEINQTVEIKHQDIISARTKQFLFEIQPEIHQFKKIFRRPIREFLQFKNDKKYIGGWTSVSARRALESKPDLQLLKDLIVELEPRLLEKIIPAESDFDGRLIEFKQNETGSGIRIRSLAVGMTQIRNFKPLFIFRNQWIDLESGDIIQFHISGTGPDLQIRFDFSRVKSRMFRGSRGHEKLVSADIIYLGISYLRKNQFLSPVSPRIAFLRTFEEGNRFRIKDDKENLFLGKKGLFLFDLRPDKLLNRQYIPDMVHEGGIMDFKSMLDRNMVYRKQHNYFPVDMTFLDQVREIAIHKESDLNRYLKQGDIDWMEFRDNKEIEHYLKNAEKWIRIMKKKRIWDRFCREIKKMNNRYFLEGIGIKAGEGIDYRVYYRIGDMSWIPAESWSRNIPEVTGIDDFYWGSQIKNASEVEFKFEFNTPPDRIQLLSIAEYGTSHDGKQFNWRHFFDGIQDIQFKKGQRTLIVKVSNLVAFNRGISTASLQMKIGIQTEKTANFTIYTDENWQAAIDMSNWMNVRQNPYFSDSAKDAAGIKSIWYPENWTPVFRGVKNRYFRKDFKLDSRPISSNWRVFTNGEYLIRVNDQPVINPGDFSRALRKGFNRLIIMVSKKGISKRFSTDSLFKIRNGHIALKRKVLKRSSFVRGKGFRKATIYDGRQRALAYSVRVNDKFQRFYTDTATRELKSLVGSPNSGSWGLEQVFHNLHRKKGIGEIHLTINSEWQKIGIRNLAALLNEIKKKETRNPVFLNRKDQLKSSENQLSQARIDLVNPKNRQFNPGIMRRIIDLETRIDILKTEINKIKNYFYEASMLIMNTRGQILMAASYPYDESGMESLNGSLSKPYRAYEVPELNRCWKWKYNPGSTAKVLDSIAFLHSVSQSDPNTGAGQFPYLRQLLNSNTDFENFPRNELKGSRMLNGKQVFFQLQNFRGHNIPYGFCSLNDAFTHSYNTYFAYLALHNNRMLTQDSAHFKRNSFFISKSNIPLEQIYREYPVLEFAEKLGFNRKIDLLSNFHSTEIGRFLNRSPYDVFTSIASVFPVNAYTPSEIAYFSIGQSDLQLTNLQNLLVASTIMNSGFLYYPSLIKSIKLNRISDTNPTLIEPDPEKLKVQIFDPTIARRIKEAMKNVVKSGTAVRVFSADMKQGRSFYAKTGTAETKFYRDHSLFVGFVTFRNGKKIIFSTVVPRSGTGAAVAGRLTARVIKEIIDFENSIPDSAEKPY